MFKTYYQLTKPGIIYGNSLSAIAGFFLAARGQVNFKLFFAMLFGLALVIASACVLNNIYDADVDGKMERTKNRAMVKKRISKISAIIFAIGLLALGIVALYYFVNQYALYAALLGFTSYVFLYTPLKRKTFYATLVGAVSGATPPVVGYAAVAKAYDFTALLLFLALVFWQMPHFYGIAIRRLEEYKAAGIPVLPLTKGLKRTKIEIVAYIVLFLAAALSLSFFKITGYVFAVVILLLGLYWLKLGTEGFNQNSEDTKWAKKVFLFSLFVLLAMSLFMSINFWLP